MKKQHKKFLKQAFSKKANKVDSSNVEPHTPLRQSSNYQIPKYINDPEKPFLAIPPKENGSVIESRAAAEADFDISTAGETKLTFTPVDAATNLFTTGSKIAFICYETGTWHIAYEFTGAAAATTGAFAFAA